QEQFRSAVEGAFAGSPFADLAKRNIAMFEAAAQAFKPGQPAPETAHDSDTELETLRAELARLNEKIEKLSK
ncbi:MAG: polyhydroxyalkanoate synthesis repressor PhaR, partial [Pseudomonadota bacterium]|nr:polyhydroxyalkanoate synthesis repressor PhaR [Pseudomonadota bacterium]